MKRATGILKLLAAVILGFIFPITLIYQSYIGLHSLTSDFHTPSKMTSMTNEVQTLKTLIHDSNDYNFISLVFLENKNFEVMQKKQVMKVIVIQLGYAMMSIGLMLIMLGFEDKEHTLSGGWESFKLDFKTGSTGALVVVIGAVMSTLGGVLKNDYNNNKIPTYEFNYQSRSMNDINSMYNLCVAHNVNDTEAAQCFMQSYKDKFISTSK